MLHWWISVSFFMFSPSIEGGGQLISILTFFLIPIGIYDKRKWHWSINHSLNNVYSGIFINSFYIIIRIQIAIVYFQAMVDKLKVSEWKNGTVLYYWFEDNVFGLNHFVKEFVLTLMTNYYVISLMTYTVLVLELLLAMAIVIPFKTRRILLYLGILFHFFIWIVHGLPTFFLTMTGALIIYIIPFYKNIDLKHKNFN
ncbi:hypothetical protein [Flavobacterium sp. JP2137]|uniref:hypothetical protein n=1 Tax=Flavobacterium sp. JP2137 TaxID=3414510 RepID=UPI003D2FED96